MTNLRNNIYYVMYVVTHYKHVWLISDHDYTLYREVVLLVFLETLLWCPLWTGGLISLS